MSKNQTKKKQAEVQNSLVIAILAVISLVIIVTVVIMIAKTNQRESNINAVQQWVSTQHLALSASKGSISLPRPPVGSLYDEPIEINNIAQILDSTKPDSAHRIIADALYDCRRAFRNGEVDFLTSDETFCFPCATVEFSKTVKASGQKLNTFASYLANTYPAGQNKPYWELIGGSKDTLPTGVWNFNTNEDLYITEVARKSGLGFEEIMAAAGAAAATGAGAGFFVGGPIGSAVAGIVAGVGTTIGLLVFDEPVFTSFVAIGPKDFILTTCSAQPKPELTQAEKDKLQREATVDVKKESSHL